MTSLEVPFFQVDAFTRELYKGNPAAVLPLEEWPSDSILQAIAQENNLSETAFFIPGEHPIPLRWFTPAAEVNLCGHATLASAHVLFSHLDYPDDTIAFSTRSGVLKVARRENGSYQMDFPADQPILQPQLQETVSAAIGEQVVGVWQGKDDLLALLPDHFALKKLTPTLSAVSQLPGRGLIVTADTGTSCDFASRCFYPKLDVPEDPVTGSAHTLLTPFWSERMGKFQLQAEQWSARGGVVICELKGDRVLLSGPAVTVIEGRMKF
jgi:PhzF family phenazine biosynthesis protein